MKIATFVRSIPNEFARVGLFKCDPPFCGHEFVIASTINGETLIFPSNERSRETDITELDGMPGNATDLFRSNGYEVNFPVLRRVSKIFAV